ncbi:MAG: hypothetical protein IPO36_17295 [Anaerolineales bacterium]|nr:hypothetical protein [Anaerolineales bacterium]
MKKKIRLFHLLIIFTLFLSACNLPSNNVEDIASTSAAQTVEALLSATSAIVIRTPTFTVAPPLVTATLTPIPLPIITSTSAATATSNCNVAQFITDVTFPDGTAVTPGQAFVKKWRIKNIGSCTWTGFSLVFDSGDSMGGPASKPISTVGPGQEIDLEVNLTAPTTTGTYKGYWRITTNGNVLVPVVSGYQGKSFYVDIKVQNTTTGSPSATATITPTATITSTPFVFTVTSVLFNVTGSCPNFNYTFSVTTSGPGTVTLHRVFSDGSADPYPATLSFNSAGTQTSPSIPMTFNKPGSSAWVDVYIDLPNQKQFGRATFTCP